MKKEVFLLLMFVFALSSVSAYGNFSIQVQTISSNEIFSFHGESSDLTINWGDGNVSTYSGTGLVAHSYLTANTYDIAINGSASRIAFGGWSGETSELLVDILTPMSNGLSGITSAYQMFMGCTNITNFTAQDWFDNVSKNVTDMRYMFNDAISFNQNLSSWNVSSVTRMDAMFFGATSFNGNVSSWDVSEVTSLNQIFTSSISFNQPLNSWDTSNVTNMNYAFYNATSFNGNVSNWDVSKVTIMNSMFRYATSFNQPLNNWNTSNVTNMYGMFFGATSFNGDVSNWNTPNVSNMNSMFRDATSFNQPLNSWNTSNVTTMNSMFRDATSFNQPLNSWNTSNVAIMYQMFYNATSFDQNLSSWNVSGVTSMADMFNNSGLSTENYSSILIGWNSLPNLQSGVTLGASGINYTVAATSARSNLISTYSWTINDGGMYIPEMNSSNSFTIQINTTSNNQIFSFQADNSDLTINWTDGNVSTYSGTGLVAHNYSTAGVHNISIQGTASRISFYGAGAGTPTLLIDILSPMSNGLTGINSSESMFRDADSITVFTAQDWFDGVSGNVTDMSYMFYDATNFDQNVSTWNTSSVTDMESMFLFASSFNHTVDNWDTSKVISMAGMFHGATSFNQPLNNWNTSSVTDMSTMLAELPYFNQPLNNWNTSSVTNMYAMFMAFSSSSFNQSLSSWDTSKVTDMGSMFDNVGSFNDDISSWNTSSVTSMSAMFRSTSFNQDISSWDTSKVINMGGMFQSSPFNQDISSWDTSNVTFMSYMFAGTPFNQPLNSWNVSKVSAMWGMFQSSPFNQSLDNWDVSSATGMYSMFRFDYSFNQNLSSWNVSSVTSMTNMFDNSGLSTENYSSILIGWNSLPSLQSGVTLGASGIKYSSSASSARSNLISTYSWTINDGGVAPTTCNSCSDCNAKIASASSGDVIYLGNSLSNIDGSCIDFAGRDNVTFDCQGNTIDGDGDNSGYGIYLNSGSDNNTINDCDISEFKNGIYMDSSNSNFVNIISNNNSESGIYFSSSSNNTFINITANSNTYGFRSGLSSNLNNTFINITTNSNDYGISLEGEYNILTNIIAQENSILDISYPSLVSSCNNKYFNITGSGGRQIEFYNYTTIIENKVLSGLILCNASNSIINNVTIASSDNLSNNALSLHFTNNVSISNVNSSGVYTGLRLFSSSNSTFINITLNSNQRGVDISSSSNNNIFTNININNIFSTGFSFSSSSNNILTNITLNSNIYGIYPYSSSNNTFKNSHIINSTNYGVYIGGTSSNNTFYNNLFNNTVNYYNSSIISNYFNTTNTTATNIMNGSYIGGNYWATPTGTGFSETCTDADADGFCDSSYAIGASNIDYLPLVNLLSCTESWSCTTWSTCTGTQSRTCSDANTCGTSLTKPAESQSCTVDDGGSSGGGGATLPPTEDDGVTEVLNGTAQTVFDTIIPNETSTIVINDSDGGFGLTDVSFDVNDEVDGASISITEVDSRDDATLQLGVGDNFATFVAFDVQKNGITNDNISNATLNFKVEKQWAQDVFGGMAGFAKYFVAMYKRETVDDPWEQVNTEFLSEDSTYYYYKAVSDGFSRFVIGLNTSILSCEAGEQRCVEGSIRQCVENGNETTWDLLKVCGNGCKDANSCAGFRFDRIYLIFGGLVLLFVGLVVVIIKFAKKSKPKTTKVFNPEKKVVGAQKAVSKYIDKGKGMNV